MAKDAYAILLTEAVVHRTELGHLPRSVVDEKRNKDEQKKYDSSCDVRDTSSFYSVKSISLGCFSSLNCVLINARPIVNNLAELHTHLSILNPMFS